MNTLLTIKTAVAVIYVANGQVTLVKCTKTGRFMKKAKFANIVNNLMLLAKNAFDASKKTGLLSKHTSEVRHTLNKFENACKMASALLKDVILVAHNRRMQGFSMVYMAMAF